MIPSLEKSPLPHFLTLFFTGWGVLALVLTWTNMFFTGILIAYAILFWGVLLLRHPRDLAPPSRRIGFHLSLLLALSFFLASFVQPATVFTGRDEGSIFSAAQLLAKSHASFFPSPESRAFFALYEQDRPTRLGFAGQALNFPGFSYTEDGSLAPQFPLPAIAWYASFLALFGFSGILVANAVLLFLFLLAATLLIKSFAAPKWTLIGAGLCTISFPLFWFSRFTLSENFILAFLWLFIWNTLSLRERPNMPNFFLFLLLSLLVLFGRIEGFAFFLMAIVALLSERRVRLFCAEKKFSRITLPVLLFLFAASTALFANLPFFMTVAKGFFGGVKEIASVETLSASLSRRFSLLLLYGIPLFSGMAGILLILIRFFRTKTQPASESTPQTNKLSTPLLILWITFPAFLYLFAPFISPDHPWMLRRLAFAVTPALILFSLFLCSSLERSRYRVASVALLLCIVLSSLPACFFFFPIRQGSDLLETTENISRTIPENELALVDRLASGDGFHMLAGPLQTLFNRHAAYIVNPDDLVHLDTSAFSSASLLVPEENVSLYQTQLDTLGAQKKETFPVSFETLEPTADTSLSFPRTVTHQERVVRYQWETK